MGEVAAGLARRGFEAFARRDLETMVEFADPEIEINVVTAHVAGRDGPYRGHDGIRQYLDDVDATWDEIDLQPRQYVEIGDERVLVLGRVRTRRGSTLIDVPNAWLWELAGGKVKSIRLFVDSESIASLLDARDEALRSRPAG
ncbi:MAG TPA: nuclear transport factor 2 family protein [Solirubrobacterales bacterium]|nr:nuclear transport factor 2 family protein [Solirubrobacterales bacterium]